jgi:hypothetical protein
MNKTYFCVMCIETFDFFTLMQHTGVFANLLSHQLEMVGRYVD